MRSRLLPVRAAIVVAAAGALVACTPSEPDTDATTDDPATEETTPAGPRTAPSCALAPPALIKATLNLDVSEPVQTTDEPVVGCTYTGPSSVILRFQSDEDASSFARGRRGFETSGQPTTDVRGFHDEAYMSSTEFGDVVSNTLVARKGAVEILVTATATVDAEKALFTKLFEALG
jgi:hypothetical protein